MKKSGILNAKLAEIIAAMGHTDQLVICDAGLPIPHEAIKVDLALTLNIPGFIDTLKAVLGELKVEKIILAKEIKTKNKKIFDQIQALLPGVEITIISHKNFKKYYNNHQNIAFIRTGEATPYANIILSSGVVF